MSWFFSAYVWVEHRKPVGVRVWVVMRQCGFTWRDHFTSPSGKVKWVTMTQCWLRWTLLRGSVGLKVVVVAAAGVRFSSPMLVTWIKPDPSSSSSQSCSVCLTRLILLSTHLKLAAQLCWINIDTGGIKSCFLLFSASSFFFFFLVMFCSLQLKGNQITK